ncbi:MAG TPA: hypothetical protein VIL43_13120 [Burkholderiales bacterium]
MFIPAVGEREVALREVDEGAVVQCGECVLPLRIGDGSAQLEPAEMAGVLLRGDADALLRIAAAGSAEVAALIEEPVLDARASRQGAGRRLVGAARGRRWVHRHAGVDQLVVIRNPGNGRGCGRRQSGPEGIGRRDSDFGPLRWSGRHRLVALRGVRLCKCFLG